MFDFHNDGFAIYPSFIHGDDLSDLQFHVDRFVRQVLPHLPRERVFFEDREDASTLKQIQHIDQYDPWFSTLFNEGCFRELAVELLGAPVVPRNLQFFNKPARVGQPTPPHQDGYYFMINPCEAVTMWLALDQADAENGCVHYIRGSHKHPLREHCRTRTLGFSQGITDFPSESDIANDVPAPADPGDLLVHHAMTIHHADGNRSSNRARRALGFIYYSEHAREDTNAHAKYQERLAADLRASGRI